MNQSNRTVHRVKGSMRNQQLSPRDWTLVFFQVVVLLAVGGSQCHAFSTPSSFLLLRSHPKIPFPLSVLASPIEDQQPAVVVVKPLRRPKRGTPTSSKKSTTTTSSSATEPPETEAPRDRLLYRRRERGMMMMSSLKPKQPRKVAMSSAVSSEEDAAIREQLQRLVSQRAQQQEVAPSTAAVVSKRARSIPAFASKRKTRSKSEENRIRRDAATQTLSPPSAESSEDALDTDESADTSTPNEFNHHNHNGKQAVTKRGRKSKHGKSSYADADLQRYYRTELLTMEEEYIYGDRVRFMIACEEAHEGLAIRLDRLPSLGEWAAACGYTVPMVKPKLTQADERLRPVGCEKMFQEVDPHMFAGNGLIGEAGPGRGRGRVRKIPHVRVKDRRADSLWPTATTESSASRNSVRAGAEPVNRGTVRDFLEMLQEGREAKQTMVQNNMRLVVSIARKYMNVGVSLNDLVQEGSLGLSRAAEKFDPRKGFKFSTYASWWIQQAVFRSIAYQSRNIRLPVHIHNMLNRIHRLRSILTKDYGRAPTNEEMASQLGMSLHKYNKLLRLTKRSISLDIAKYASNPKDFGHEGDDRLADTIDATSVGGELLDEGAPEQMVDHTLFLDDLNNMIQILDKDEKMVLCARYGLTDGITRTVTSVAAQMKQSKAWVRSQECRALRKLRRPWYEKKLKEHESSLNSY